MQRRKFIAGMGSLAAAGAAGIGTGAFTTSSSARTVDVNVASDSNGFVEISAQNETYASGTDDGQLELDFNSDSGLGIYDGDAQGLNPDSTFNFSEVFRVANISGTGDMRVVVEAEGFDLERLELTDSASESNDHSTFYNSDEQYVDGNLSLRAEDHDSPNTLPKLDQPDHIDVDMTIETKDDDTTGNVGGTLTIYAATGGNRDKLSDVV
jgi:hypothetical protein